MAATTKNLPSSGVMYTDRRDFYVPDNAGFKCRNACDASGHYYMDPGSYF